MVLGIERRATCMQGGQRCTTERTLGSAAPGSQELWCIPSSCAQAASHCQCLVNVPLISDFSELHE